MKIYDTVNKEDIEVDGVDGLIQKMEDGRQVDFYLKETKQDADGYLTWDEEHWVTLDERRYVRYYSLKGKVIKGESTRYVKSDIKAHFQPETAEKITLS